MIVALAAGAWQSSGRKVTGIVLDADTQRPVVGARVEYDDTEAAEIETTRTDDKGAFEFTRGTRGTVTVMAQGYGTAYRRWPPVRSRTGLEIVLMPPSTVVGTVADMSSGQRLSEAEVTLTVEHPQSYVSDTAETDSRGEFIFEDLPPGPGLITAHAPGYAPYIRTLTIADKTTTTTAVKLLLQGAATGTVVDSDGDPVQGAELSVRYTEFPGGEQIEGFVGGRMRTGMDGVFTLDGIVPDTPLEVWAVLDDTASAAATLVIAPGMIQEEIVLRIQ